MSRRADALRLAACMIAAMLVRDSLHAVLLFCLGLACLEARAEEAPADGVTYRVTKPEGVLFGTLEATRQGKTQELVGRAKEQCLEVVDARDFDGNGTTDALVAHVSGCGGDCCPNAYFFVSAAKDGRFTVTKEFADSWESATVEKWGDAWSVVVTSSNAGASLDRLKEVTRRFALRHGKPVQLSAVARKEKPALADLRAEAFRKAKADDVHSIRFDLDADGKPDEIFGTLWERWGSVMWTVRFADGKTFVSATSCKRIGVLPSKTKGVHDLVCDLDRTLFWSGSEYLPTAP